MEIPSEPLFQIAYTNNSNEFKHSVFSLFFFRQIFARIVFLFHLCKRGIVLATKIAVRSIYDINLFFLPFHRSTCLFILSTSNNGNCSEFHLPSFSIKRTTIDKSIKLYSLDRAERWRRRMRLSNIVVYSIVYLQAFYSCYELNSNKLLLSINTRRRKHCEL